MTSSINATLYWFGRNTSIRPVYINSGPWTTLQKPVEHLHHTCKDQVGAGNLQNTYVV